MAARRRSKRYEEEELQLEEVLEPYQYAQEEYYDEPVYDQQGEPLYHTVDYQPYPEPGYADYQTEGEGGNRLGVAVHVFDVISSLVGVFVILILIAMLLTLVDWLRTDLLHSFVLLQSGIS